MGKKIFQILAGIMLVLIAVPIIWTIQDSMESMSSVESAIFNQSLIWIVVYIVNGIIFGTLTNYISRIKGYEKGFAWGFWLGLIGLLVVGFRPSLKQDNVSTSIPVQKSDNIEMLTKLAKLHEEGIWTDEEFQQKKKELLEKM